MTRQDAQKPDLVRDIQEAWREAQVQLGALREQVEYATRLAQAKVQGNTLERSLDKAYRALGEAVWKEVAKGRLALPSSLSAVRRAVDEVRKEVDAQQAGVADLIAEGEEVAGRAREKAKEASKAVAQPSRKR